MHTMKKNTQAWLVAGKDWRIKKFEDIKYTAVSH